MSTVKITCGHKLERGDKLFCSHCVDELVAKLANWREQIGKRETELMAEVGRLKERNAQVMQENDRLLNGFLETKFVKKFNEMEAKLAVAREALETIIANPKSCCAEAHDLVAQGAFAKLNDEASGKERMK